LRPRRGFASLGSFVIAADGHGGALVMQASAGGDRCSAIRQTAEKMKKRHSCYRPTQHIGRLTPAAQHIRTY
jgi:hypothetical protein